MKSYVAIIIQDYKYDYYLATKLAVMYSCTFIGKLLTGRFGWRWEVSLFRIFCSFAHVPTCLPRHNSNIFA